MRASRQHRKRTWRLVAVTAAAGALASAFGTCRGEDGQLSVSAEEGRLSVAAEKEVAFVTPSGLEKARLEALAKAVAERPRERSARFELVRGLRDAGQLEEAIAAAREWRAHDAYNLVAVRMLGDILSRAGEKTEARRVYSAVAELLPDDAGAQRALATVLKQSGDLAAAHLSLGNCVRAAPNDKRLAFELADLLARLGRTDEARERLQALASDRSVPETLQVPARQRLAQILAHDRHEALRMGDGRRAIELASAIRGLGLPGASENDIRVFLTWDTDKSDVDLWVTTPFGERIYYRHRKGLRGEALYHDVTTGYGPETFSVPLATRGTYQVQVHYYRGGGGRFPEARGEVTVVLDEGRAGERREVFPYEIEKPGMKAAVARIDVR